MSTHHPTSLGTFWSMAQGQLRWPCRVGTHQVAASASTSASPTHLLSLCSSESREPPHKKSITYRWVTARCMFLELLEALAASSSRNMHLTSRCPCRLTPPMEEHWAHADTHLQSIPNFGALSVHTGERKGKVGRCTQLLKYYLSRPTTFNWLSSGNRSDRQLLASTVIFQHKMLF